MTLDGFLGFLALFIAFYAIISPVTRLRAQLHLAIQFPLAFLAVTLVLYFEFFHLVGQPCWIANKEICQWITFPSDDKFTPQQAAFLVVFIWMIFALVLNKYLRPGTGALPGISKIVQEFLYDHRFAELLDFIRPHLSLIETTAQRQRPLQKLHDWFDNADRFQRQKFQVLRPDEGQAPVEDKPTFTARSYEAFRRHISWIAVFIPAQRKAQDDAETIARILLRSEELRKFVVSMRPDALPDLMAIKLRPRFDFADKVLRDLITDNGSKLYQEIENNQNLTRGGGYVIPEQNTLLNYLFGDADVAHKLGAWKPVGEYVINNIRAGSKNGYTEYLNERADNFDEEQWGDSTFVAIRYFDIMVHEAMRQGVRDHMWLFYFHHFVEELEKCYDASGPGIDNMSEFPTRNAHLIYAIFEVLGGWVKAGENLDNKSPHAVTAATDERSLSVIPMGASIALGNVMVTVALSRRIGDSFASYTHECILHAISSLPREGQGGQMRATLIHAIVAGGFRNPDAIYGERLNTFLAMTDHVLRGDVEDYVEAIKTAFPDT